MESLVYSQTSSFAVKFFQTASYFQIYIGKNYNKHLMAFIILHLLFYFLSTAANQNIVLSSF